MRGNAPFRTLPLVGAHLVEAGQGPGDAEANHDRDGIAKQLARASAMESVTVGTRGLGAPLWGANGHPRSTWGADTGSAPPRPGREPCLSDGGSLREPAARFVGMRGRVRQPGGTDGNRPAGRGGVLLRPGRGLGQLRPLLCSVQGTPSMSEDSPVGAVAVTDAPTSAQPTAEGLPLPAIRLRGHGDRGGRVRAGARRGRRPPAGRPAVAGGHNDRLRGEGDADEAASTVASTRGVTYGARVMRPPRRS